VRDFSARIWHRVRAVIFRFIIYSFGRLELLQKASFFGVHQISHVLRQLPYVFSKASKFGSTSPRISNYGNRQQDDSYRAYAKADSVYALPIAHSPDLSVTARVAWLSIVLGNHYPEGR
jgi:hypothetical protein